jgi:hypothetical protein
VCQQKIQTSVDATTFDIEQLLDNKKGTSWSDIVAKEVESKMRRATTDVAALHMQTKAMLQDKEKQETKEDVE